MTAAAAQPQGVRGNELLLAHCAALELRDVRASAVERLEQAVGRDLTQLLLRALAAKRSPAMRFAA